MSENDHEDIEICPKDKNFQANRPKDCNSLNKLRNSNSTTTSSSNKTDIVSTGEESDKDINVVCGNSSRESLLSFCSTDESEIEEDIGFLPDRSSGSQKRKSDGLDSSSNPTEGQHKRANNWTEQVFSLSWV